MSRITFRGRRRGSRPPASHGRDVPLRADRRSRPDLQGSRRGLRGAREGRNSYRRERDGQAPPAPASHGGCVPTDDHTIHRIDSAPSRSSWPTRWRISARTSQWWCSAGSRRPDGGPRGVRGHGLHQSMELSGRRDELKRWQDGEAQVLAVQIDAGSEGVDLTRARYSIFYSVWFSLGKYDQALARVAPARTDEARDAHPPCREEHGGREDHARSRKARGHRARRSSRKSRTSQADNGER